MESDSALQAFSSSTPTPITKRKWRVCLIGSGLRFYAEDDVCTLLDVKIKKGSEARLLALLLLSYHTAGVTTWTTASIADKLWSSSDAIDANRKATTRKAIERLLKALQPWIDGGFSPLITRQESQLILHREAYSTDLEVADIQYRFARQNFAPHTSESRNAWKEFLASCGTGDILSRWDVVTNIFLISPRQQLNSKQVEGLLRLAENAEMSGDLEIALRYARQATSLPSAESNLLTQVNQVINRIQEGKPAPPTPATPDVGLPQYAPGRNEHPIVGPPVFSFSPSVPFYGNLFFGRERERETLNHYVEDSDTRLITLCGTAGVGKTRLMLEWAAAWYGSQKAQHNSAELRSLFLVNLAALHRPEQVLDATREALKLSPVPGHDPIEQVTAFLRGLYRPILLFDNAEHLQTPPSQNGTNRDEDQPLAVFFEQLLKYAPAVTLMVTSRQILGLPAEQPLFVTALLPDESVAMSGPPVDTFADIQKWDGACLFIDRANKARAHKAQNKFALREDNAATIGRIVRLLDGLPLALELVAGNMATYRLGQIEAMLENTLNGTAPPESFWRLTSRRFAEVSSSKDARHASLWAAVALSFEALPPVCQHLLRRLSVFRGGATLDALQAVCFDAFGEDAPSSHELTVLLEGLERQSLLQVQLHGDDPEYNGENVSADEGENRYFLLETLRAFGKAVLSEAERLRLSRHHAAYFLRLVQAADKDAYTSEAAHAFALINAERGNIETSLRFLINAGATDSAARVDALRLVSALRLFQVEEKWIEQLLSQPSGHAGDLSPEEKAVRISALCRMGWICVEKGATAQAEVWAQQGIALAKETNAPLATQAELWRLLGASKMENEPAQAHAIYLAVVTMAEESDDVVLCNTLHGLGTLAVKRNDLEAGKKWYEQSLEISQRIGYLRRAAITIGALGSVLMLWRRYPEALSLAHESLDIQMRLKNTEGIAHAQRLVGDIYLLSGDSTRARPFFEKYERNASRAGNRLDMGLIHRSFGCLALHERRWHDAFGALQQSLNFLYPLGLPRETAASLCWCALVTGAAGLPEACTVLWHAGLACCTSVGGLGDVHLMETSESYLLYARAVLGEDAYASAQEIGLHLTAGAAIQYIKAIVFPTDIIDTKQR